MTERSIRTLLIRGVIVAAIVSLAYAFLVGPAVPDAITIYTGPEGTSFARDGERYAEELARIGIEAKLVATDGSLANLDSLVAGGTSRAAFAEAALINLYQIFRRDSLAAAGRDTSEARNLGLVSLGALRVEPFWLFSLAETEIASEQDIEGLVVFPGREGSGTRALAEALVRVNGLDDVVVFEPEVGQESVQIEEAFRRGDVDVLFAMGDPLAPSIRSMLTDTRIRPLSFRRSAAYDRRFPFIDALTLPEGTVDLETNVPSEELELIGSTIQLVTTPDLHPVLVDALLKVAQDIHSGSTLFSARATYPNADPASLPLDPTAERFYSEGFAKWRSYVPFWLATWFDRFALAFGVLAAAGIGLGILLRLIAWPFHMLVTRFTGRIVKVEQEAADPGIPTADLVARLDAIEVESGRIWVPPGQKIAYLEFRQLITDTRMRIEEREVAPAG